MTNLLAHWPAPANVCALTTTRLGGISESPFDTNNLGLHVGDDPHHVLANRQAVRESLQLTDEPVWLNQIHSNLCVVAEDETNRDADAAITRSLRHPLVIMTADCLPIMLCNQTGDEIAAIHSGWRGLVNGIVENTINKMHSPPETLMAWIGPAICQTCFEVGDDVWQAYTSRYPFTAVAFKQKGEKKLADLPKMAELILNSQGVNAVYQSGACSFELERQFYSYRRQTPTGRMATLIWLKQDNK